MVYIKVEEGEITKVGTLYILLPKLSNPVNLSEEELKDLGVYKPISDLTVKNPWQIFEGNNYSFDGDNITETTNYSNMSLEEFKELKYRQLSKEVHDYVTGKYPYYKQLSALNGTYDEETCNEIKSYCDAEVKRALTIKTAISDATSYEDVDAVYYRLVEYDEETLEIISETFWGD